MRTTGLVGRRGLFSKVPPEEPPSDVVPQLTGPLLPFPEGHQAVLAVLPEHLPEAIPCDAKELLPKRFSLHFIHGTSSPGRPDEGGSGEASGELSARGR